MSDFDVELIKFYHQVLNDETGLGSTETNKKTLKKVTDAFSRGIVDSRSSAVKFDSPATRAAYVYEYGPCITSSVHNHFLELMHKNSWLAERMIRKDSITICCLGGGPALEIVSIAKVLEQILLESLPKRQIPLKINAIVMDSNKTWAITAGNVIHMLPKILQTDIMQFHLYFLETNLRKSLTDDVKEVIKKCDVVTMVRFLSTIPKSDNRENITEVIKEIVDCVQESAVLFFMDSFRCQQFDTLKEVIDSVDNIIEIYGPIQHHIHRLSLLTMRECLRLYSKHYGWRYCCMESTNCISAWYRKVSQRGDRIFQRFSSDDYFCDKVNK